MDERGKYIFVQKTYLQYFYVCVYLDLSLYLSITVFILGLHIEFPSFIYKWALVEVNHHHHHHLCISIFN
jgi:hypothetical protein